MIHTRTTRRYIQPATATAYSADSAFAARLAALGLGIVLVLCLAHPSSAWAAGNTRITALSATDASTIGSNVDMRCTVRNNSSALTNSSINYIIWWDTNGNGSFDAGDLYVDTTGTSRTYSGSGSPGTHATFPVSVPDHATWSDPGWSISNAGFPNQGTYRLTATWKDSAGATLDTQTVQFFSVPTLAEIVSKLAAPSLPLVVLGGIIWVAALVRLRRRRHWLSFYALGALGTVLMSLFLAQVTGFDQLLETLEARQVAGIAHAVRINVSFLPSSGLAIENHVGWGIFDVGIECSALLEMAAFAGLVAFYPGFTCGRKAFIVTAGVLATYIINVARILIIVDTIAQLGTGSVFIAHAVIGRLFFFAGIVVMYWALLTVPTVRLVSSRLAPASAWLGAEADDPRAPGRGADAPRQPGGGRRG